ncbi:MAG: NAD(P)/FAD-dependent oxidoreductase [Gemmatimonadota bacterium]|nr:NAD(P)/FAD-dependent oxidoreductase [Gemmatimonadota bacterium]
MTTFTSETRGLPRVVIIGGGFGGLWAARAFRGEQVRVTVVDRTNHHLFQPLLYEVALAGLAPSDITIPIRWALRRDRHAEVVLGEVTRIDVASKAVLVDGTLRIPYDFLIVAAGSRHAYFGHDAWETDAPGLKSIEDALEIRRRFLLAFERAERADNAADREALSTLVIVGGGPTGVELAATASEIVRKALPRDFRRVDTRKSRIILVEAGPRLLPSFPEKLGARARRDLEALGVDVRLGVPVSAVDARGVAVGAEQIEARTVFWAAGNAASPLARDLGVPLDRVGRVIVNDDLSVPGHPGVFVVGDLALTKRPDGTPLPGVAQVAMQGGRHAARNVMRLIRHGPTRPFRYRNLGDMATIGRNRAVGVFPWGTAQGLPAWILWLFVHIAQLIGFRNRAIVLIQWAYAYFTFQRGVRLITASDRAQRETQAPRR